MTRPEYRMHLRGTHTEHRTRSVTKTDSNGRTTHETEHYTETVTGKAEIIVILDAVRLT